MHFVYILRSKKHRRLYLGSTNDLRDRIEQHNSGKVQSTKVYLPWCIVYYEAYSSETEARHREHNLKLRANAWSQLKRRINKSINAD
ncbi:MAG: GIY-YIG nuclease family protein [bacterium]